MQAQASGAKVIAFANGGGDMVNATKQANEFGLTKNQTIVSLLVFISDVHSMQLQAAQGLKFVTAFYWDRNEETRAWSKRFFDKLGRMPTMPQAAVYSAIRHYLGSIAAAGTDEAKAVMAKMRERPVNDFYVKNGHLREDGRLVHDMYLAQVKTPAESKGPWDYYKVLSTIPGDQAFRLARGRRLSAGGALIQAVNQVFQPIRPRSGLTAFAGAPRPRRVGPNVADRPRRKFARPPTAAAFRFLMRIAQRLATMIKRQATTEPPNTTTSMKSGKPAAAA